ncbi:hypothetical protein BDV59DRAFT_166699 [Aspergillus ambiguus]|uniref:putative NmrA-like family protein n=1 Tax=Aspergillus ambiguus TaxID=176160 RepID=UPI003CCC9678
MTLRYLIVGATGGLGAEVLNYFVENTHPNEYAAASSQSSMRSHFESQGIAFRHVSYDDPATLESALTDVENVLFVSTPVFDIERRNKQHKNFIIAAKKMDVKHVWYTSLAFGGLTSDSKALVQQSHYMTEKWLEESGINFTSIREGAYADAFPVFINWYPESKQITLPIDGRVAFALRRELGEATARLMIEGGHDREIVLLTPNETITYSEIVDIINETAGRNVEFRLVSDEEFLERAAEKDPGGKDETFFRMVLTWHEAIRDGDLEATDPLMGKVLEREPMAPGDAVRHLLENNHNYTWHQNYKKE